MGAFDSELYKLGYRFIHNQTHVEPSQEVKDRTAAVEAMHLAKMPCPGSCGERCPNHYCPAHNGQPYKMLFRN